MLFPLKRPLVIAALICAFLAAGQGSALADCHGDGDNAGSGSFSVGPTTSSQSLSWTLSTRTVGVNSFASAAMSTSVCLDSVVDWMTGGSNGGHYDARIARTCQPGGGTGGGIVEPAGFGGSNVTGLQKAAACQLNQTPNPDTWSGCVYDTESHINPATGNYCWLDAAVPFGSPCVWMYLRYENGEPDISKGGDVNSC